MAAAEIISAAPQELAAQAHTIITSREFDYFESGSAARAHARNEGVDESQLTENGLGYTKVPRQYAEDFQGSLETAFGLLAGDDPQYFLHVSRDIMTLGQTDPAATEEIGLTVPSHKLNCSLRLEACDFVSLSVNTFTLSEKPPTKSHGALELPLGRSIWTATGNSEMREQAIADSHRDWERALIVGGSAITSFITHSLNSFEAVPEREQAGLSLKKRSVMLGALLGLMQQEFEEESQAEQVPASD